MSSRPTAFDAALPEFPSVQGGAATPRRRRRSAFDAALPQGDVTSALARGEQVTDPQTSETIAAGGYVGTRPSTPMELEARKNRRAMGLDGGNPWVRAGLWQGRGTL